MDEEVPKLEEMFADVWDGYNMRRRDVDRERDVDSWVGFFDRSCATPDLFWTVVFSRSLCRSFSIAFPCCFREQSSRHRLLQTMLRNVCAGRTPSAMREPDEGIATILQNRLQCEKSTGQDGTYPYKMSCTHFVQIPGLSSIRRWLLEERPSSTSLRADAPRPRKEMRSWREESTPKNVPVGSKSASRPPSGQTSNNRRRSPS